MARATWGAGLKTLHLFAGAGGGILADLILGHTPIGAVEIELYCCQLLREKADAGWWPQLQVHETDIRDFDPSEYAGRVDCVSGGFPCQDISAAGRGEGITGSRSGLWAEYARILGALRPRYAFIENSPMLTLRGLDVVLSDIAALGYDAAWAVISAADVGAPHLRERIWILAHNPGDGRRTGLSGGFDPSGKGECQQPLSAVANTRSRRCARAEGRQVELARGTEAVGATEVVAHADRLRQSQPQGSECEQRGWAGDGCCAITNPMQHGLERIKQAGAKEGPVIRDGGWWTTEPALGRVAYGLAHRAHRLKALGNGQVPQQAALAWNLLISRLPNPPAPQSALVH